MFDNLKTLIWGKNLSKKTAKNRLQMVLVQDRSGLTSKDMEFFKKDLLEVISKYFVVETTSLQVEWKRNDSSTALVINTPITGRTRADRKLATAG